MKKDKLNKIKMMIEEHMDKDSTPLPKAAKIIEKEGINDASNVLKALGYQIIWHGINPETAIVAKPHRQENQQVKDKP
jgi:hypothetical protein